MKNLLQEVYEDDNGRPFEAGKIDCLAPYTHICDGFYNWTCGVCGEDHSSRWWNISGRVSECQKCHKMNLLVRTNTKEITEAISGKWKSEETVKENERLHDTVKYNEEQLKKIRMDVMNIVEQALTDAKRKIAG